jgi:hypothetical protein
MKVNKYGERTIAFRPVNTYWNFTSGTGNQTVIDLMDRLWLARPLLDHLVGYLSPIFHGYAAKSGLVNLRDLSKKLLNYWVKRHDVLPPFRSSIEYFFRYMRTEETYYLFILALPFLDSWIANATG